MSKPKHYQDPSYAGFVERYSTDIVAFAEEVLALEVSPVMADIMRTYSKPGARVTISSDLNRQDRWNCSPLAPLALWRLFFARSAPDQVSTTLVGCPLSKLRSGNDYRRLALRAVERQPWLQPYMHVTGEQIYLDDRWAWNGSHIRFMAVRAAAPANIAGFALNQPHAAWLMEDAHVIASICYRAAGEQLNEPSASMVLSALKGRTPARDVVGASWVDYEFAGAAMPQSTPKRQ